MSRLYRVTAPAVGEFAGRIGYAARFPGAALALTAIVLPMIAGCTTDQGITGSIKPDATAKADIKGLSGARHVAAVSADKHQRNCLVRAMYFESNRSSPDGMLAVGSVVMNRVKSSKFPNTICGVVGQRHQFAPGVMSRRMGSPALPKVEAVADVVVSGARHKKVGDAKFFHTAGLHFPYNNMHYVAIAGGNAFYQKTTRYARNTQADVKAAKATEVASTTAVVPVPSDRPEDAMPGVSTAYAARSTADKRIETAFAAATR